MHVSDTCTLEGTPDQLSRSLRCTVAEVHSAVSDLKAADAAVVTERNGVLTLVSRRRKRELEKRLMNRERVRKFRSNAECPSDSDCSDSGLDSGKGGVGENPDDGDLPYILEASELPDPLKNPEFCKVWPLWVAHRARKKSTALNRRSARLQLKKLAEWGMARAVAAIEHSVAGAYQGIFEPKTTPTQQPQVSKSEQAAIAKRIAEKTQ